MSFRNTSSSVAERISRSGGGVYLYESWATMPLIDPGIFDEFVVPYNRRVIDYVASRFATPPPAMVMGGNITRLMEYFLRANTSLIACDYNADFDFVKAKTAGTGIIVRGCVDPKTIERGGWETLQASIDRLAEKARGMVNFIWGCGCVSYRTPPQSVRRFKQMCAEARV